MEPRGEVLLFFEKKGCFFREGEEDRLGNVLGKSSVVGLAMGDVEDEPEIALGKNTEGGLVALLDVSSEEGLIAGCHEIRDVTPR